MAKTILFSLLILFLVPSYARKKLIRDIAGEIGSFEVLALRPRLRDEEWLSLLGERRRNELYQVRQGDTLWGISARYSSSPFLWRKLWQVNPTLTNPHELGVGTMLTLYREGDRGPASDIIRIPLVRLSTSGGTSRTPGATDIDTSVAVTRLRGVKDVMRPMVYVLENPSSEILGQITGAYTEQNAITEHDEFFLEIEEDRVGKGEALSLVRMEEELDPVNKDFPSGLGTLARLVGEVKLEAKGERLYRATLTAMYKPVRRGDKLVAMQKPIEGLESTYPPDDLDAEIVGSDVQGRERLGQGDMVLLNKGGNEGMKPGFLFRILMDKDPSKDGGSVEASHKGEVVVLRVGTNVSTGYILRNTSPVEINDKIVAYQKFPERPRPPSRSDAVIEIN